MATALTLIGSNPARFAAARPARTFSSPSRRVSSRKRPGSSVSSETFSRRSPASKSAWACSASRMPLVVRPDVANAADGDEQPHELVEVLAHQGLAAGEPDLVHAQRRRDADELRDLLEGEQLGTVEERRRPPACSTCSEGCSDR